METRELDFDLPPELIAQEPAAERDACRLLVHRAGMGAQHTEFRRLGDYLRAGDLLVLNDSRVIPARFLLRKSTGGEVEGLFVRQLAQGEWVAMLRNAGRHAQPMAFVGEETATLQIIESQGEGLYRCRVTNADGGLLDRVGRMPLPPYIRRAKGCDPRDPRDREWYQNLFAGKVGSVACPTAGLHFTRELLSDLAAKRIQNVSVTLHVGLGTFKTVQVENLDDHAMHEEEYTIGPETAEAISLAKSQGRRIIACGTTVARVLESQPAGKGVAPAAGTTRIFIRPPYEWRHVNGLITNFHLPRSTLVALVGAFVGMEQMRAIYRDAIERRYRFFSYGDAMFLS